MVRHHRRRARAGEGVALAQARPEAAQHGAIGGFNHRTIADLAEDFLAGMADQGDEVVARRRIIVRRQAQRMAVEALIGFSRYIHLLDEFQ